MSYLDYATENEEGPAVFFSGRILVKADQDPIAATDGLLLEWLDAAGQRLNIDHVEIRFVTGQPVGWGEVGSDGLPSSIEMAPEDDELL